MSRRRTLERHRRSLAQIREILNSMKTLAYMETRKLDRFLDAQNAVVRDIQDVAADLLSFNPYTLGHHDHERTIRLLLLIGTERGFCGDLNHSLLLRLDATLKAQPGQETRLIAIGRKLHSLLEGDDRLASCIDGASVAEEVPAVLDRLVTEIDSLQTEIGPMEVSCLYQSGQDNVELKSLLPPFREFSDTTPRFTHPPVVNFPASDLLLEVADQFLFAALHAMLYNSLMAENYHRVSHLERAVRRLDDRSEQMAQQSNKLRQEEIIEEIEVILLSAASLGENPATQDRRSASDTVTGQKSSRWLPRGPD